MNIVIIGTSFGFGIFIGVLVMALFNLSARLDEDEDKAEIMTLRTKLATAIRQLAACQEASIKNQDRADTYYQLYCDGAKANAQLQKENGYATTH